MAPALRMTRFSKSAKSFFLCILILTFCGLEVLEACVAQTHRLKNLDVWASYYGMV